MYKALIVEDDRIVRQYMSDLSIWSEFDIEITDVARDGVEALEKKKQWNPDLIITDISMPRMDGIEMIEEIRELDQTVYIMVLSCHDEFEYVKEAMKLGADEYILKDTFSEETLMEILPHTVKSLRKGNHKEENFYARQDLKFYFFNQLMAGTLVGEERETKRVEAQIAGKFIHCAVINCYMAKWNLIKYQSLLPEWDHYSRQVLENLENHFGKYLENYKDYIEILYLGEGHFCCFVDVSNECRVSQMQQQLIKIVSVMGQCLKQEPYQYVTGVSDICAGEANVKQAVLQARNMVKLSFYTEETVLYYAGGLGHHIVDKLPENVNHLRKQLPIFLKEDKDDEIIFALQNAVKDFKKEFTAPNLVIKWVKDMDQSLQVEREEDFYASIFTIKDVESVCAEYKVHILSLLVSTVPEYLSPALCSALTYIHENYKNKIGLKEVAGAIHMNASYLSTLFQKEMSVGFARYLLELRIRTAKKLLVNTNYKVKDVAEQSGFYDYHYFARAFKNMTDLSPLEYRKANKREGLF
ncbi:two-component system response regulator YesN [Aequitasia blattaphilus]|uniref:Stage 0 sporulation protein A homolog n=1 Tax=Aequitasia blattaphilus TaxID=2949332 RepID=A0ABT1ECL9_9FIRM|nr:response regulator [Aequitasia blattaphilus]MCP1103570.1 response regulator [Aequitasia blattaphilus]MCR8616210.1 response regulator [Aequitasia blattaphilus]